MIYKIENVECLWPKLDRAYKFDTGQNRSVSVDATDPEGNYEVNLVLTEAQAKELAGKMRSEFAAQRKDDWKDWAPKSLAEVFKKDETGHYIAKITKKTFADPLTKPNQWMLNGSPAAADFQLTSGSKIHIQFLIKPWNYAGNSGVGLRPTDIMVVELAERTSAGGGNPFADKAVGGNPFGLPDQSTPSAPPPPALSDIDDEIPF